jgi:hypothetical protein
MERERRKTRRCMLTKAVEVLDGSALPRKCRRYNTIGAAKALRLPKEHIGLAEGHHHFENLELYVQRVGGWCD